jgi:hypothetical protein
MIASSDSLSNTTPGQKSGSSQLTVQRQLFGARLRSRSEQPKPPERLLNRRDLFRWARILFWRGSRCYEAELFFAVLKPCAFGHEAVLARDPLLDFLIGGPLAGWLLLRLISRLARISSIIFANSHFSFQPKFDTTHGMGTAQRVHCTPSYALHS